MESEIVPFVLVGPRIDIQVDVYCVRVTTKVACRVGNFSLTTIAVLLLFTPQAALCIKHQQMAQALDVIKLLYDLLGLHW